MKNSIGYQAILEITDAGEFDNYCKSFIEGSEKKSFIEKDRLIQIFPKNYALKNPNDILSNLEFALKYESLNLDIVRVALQHIDKNVIEQAIKSKPLGKFERKIWFLYEFLFDTQLTNIEDLKTGNYFDILDKKEYFVVDGKKSKRHRINNNLLGNKYFCPVVRRTEFLKKYLNKKLNQKAEKLFKKYDSSDLKRAIRYLYLEETISTWQIEKEIPSKKKESRFILALERAASIKKIDKQELIKLQNIIVDKNVAADDYRNSQIFVGSFNRSFRPVVHYIPPKPEDLKNLMDGLLECFDEMLKSDLDPVIISGIISFGFVFLHPFEDGNGRIHRFLIHYILSKKNFCPNNLIFPISAIMLNNISRYKNILEYFSNFIMSKVDYDIVDKKLIVNDNFAHYYSYFDYTSYCEYIYESIESALDNDIKDELDFLTRFDKAKKEINKFIDLPDNEINLIIKFIIENKGKLSKQKNSKFFKHLDEGMILKIEKAVIKNLKQS